MPQNSVNDILQTRDGYLWLATFGGLVRFDGVRFVVFDRSVDGLKSQRIKALCEDSKGTLWAGTEEGMLIRYRDGRFTTYAPENRLYGEEVFMIQEDDESNLWISGRGVLIKFDGGRFVNYRSEKFVPEIGSNPGGRRLSWYQDSAGLHSLFKGRDQTYSLPRQLRAAQIIGVNTDLYGGLWVQTRGAGVAKLANGHFKLYTMKEGLPSNDVEGVFLEDRKGNLWLADSTGRLYRIRNGKNEQILTFPSESLIALYEDREGNVWVGTPEGLYRMPESAITLQTVREGLSSNWVYSVLEDRAGAVWIGTWGGGVNKYKNGTFVSYNKGDGLPSGNITSIYEDRSGRLWVGANGGLSFFNKSRFERFDDENYCSSRAGDTTVNKRHLCPRIGGSALMDFAGAR